MSGIHRLVHPDQLQQFLSCVFTFLHWDNCVDTSRMYPCNLLTYGNQREIFWEISSMDIIPESSSSSQDMIILKRVFWCWACNLFNCIQLVTLFELFTKCLQNRCHQFWRVRAQQRGLHLKIPAISLRNVLRMLFKVAFQGCFDSPTVCEETRCFA